MENDKHILDIDQLLADLNPEQKEAVQTVDGPVMVFAGAGTGKTKTLISRIAYMIEACHIAPYHILAITFTKKATNEMRERLSAMIGEQARFVHISTIHSLCARILRRNAEALGFLKNFEIIDEDDQIKAMNEIFKKNEIEKRMLSPKTALKAIGDYKNGSCLELMGLFKVVYAAYQSYLKENNMMDFEDLLTYTLQLFQEHPDILAFYQEEFQYLLVDELQDTNGVQYGIVNLLCQQNENIFAVGDDDQSIYSFRGAKIENMMKFKEDHPKAHIIKLVQNYRSTQEILKGANAVIKNNKIREEKELYSQIPGSKHDVSLQEAYYYEDEVRYVVNEIATLVNHYHYDYKDIAVIYRNGALSRNFEIAFIQERIPYNIYGSFAFLKRKEVKDIISYLRFIASPTKMIHFKRIINVPSRGVGEKTIEKLQEYMEETGCDILGSIDIFKERNNTSKTESLIEFKQMMENLMESLNHMSLVEFFDYMLEKTGYLAMLQEEADEDEKKRVDNVNEFKSILYQLDHDHLEEGLTNIEKIEVGLDDLLLDVTTVDDHQADGVVLSTIHSVKGLEFRAVFVVGLEEGIFPSIRDEVDMEEERRIAYVAFTRAKEKIYITCATRRLIYGRIVRNPKSRFLIEYLTTVKNPVQEEKKEAISSTQEIEIGTRINHKFFGNGLVVAKDDRFVQILFDKDKSIKKITKDHPTLTVIVEN
ncbi:MAG: ATP-dependent helicase [Prevotella sp.]|nr:ATP-dependent helicase [Staphylococcus sp.]MCM1350135.1 ATP-dependent helicase [Prevotella sp.]